MLKPMVSHFASQAESAPSMQLKGVCTLIARLVKLDSEL